jgi:hypothetical protein
MNGCKPSLNEAGAVLAAVKTAAGPHRASTMGTPVRAGFAGGLRPVLTAAARAAVSISQAGAEKRRSTEPRNILVNHGHPNC